MRLPAVVVLTATPFFCCAPKSRVVNTPQTPVSACSMIVMVEGDRGSGYGAPVAPNMLLTVNHVASSGTNVVNWKGRFQAGQAVRLWASPSRDLAMYTIESGTSFHSWFTVADEKPPVSENVYYTGYLAENTAPGGCWYGQFLGQDKQDLVVWGFGHPGVSGSPLINLDGELIGIMNGAGNWSKLMGGSTPWTFSPEDFAKLVESTHIRTSFPSALFATPVLGGLPGPDKD